MKGLIHIYTGDGKGKTTAAMGLALRAAGRGKRVVIVQFLKGRNSGEVYALNRIAEITLLRNKRDYGFFKFLKEEERALMASEHNANLKQALQLVESGQCDLLILDEAIAAYNLGALDKTLVDGLLCDKKEALELVLTGRDAPARFLEAADYVSHIQKIRHPFDQGVGAREGIEF